MTLKGSERERRKEGERMGMTEVFRLPNRKTDHRKTGKIRIALGFSIAAFTTSIISREQHLQSSDGKKG